MVSIILDRMLYGWWLVAALCAIKHIVATIRAKISQLGLHYAKKFCVHICADILETPRSKSLLQNGQALEHSQAMQQIDIEQLQANASTVHDKERESMAT